MTDSVLLSTDSRGVATLTMNRPEKHNAFDDAIIAELTQKLEQLNGDERVRIVVLTGAGKSFSAGADLNWMRSMAGYSEQQNAEDALKLANLMETLDTLRKPTIARVNGPAYGGGVGLTACCDFAIASEAARFALTEVRLGLVPAVISPYVIAAIGAHQARRYFLTGEVIDAQQACVIGLVHETVPHDVLNDTVEHYVLELLKGGPKAVLAAKQLIADQVVDSKARAALKQKTAQLIAKMRVSPEGQEGLTAFLEKRPPNWHK